MATYGGWTGKTLRVNLTTGQITTEDTIAKYRDFLGGTGVGYKVLWDEVPAGTKAFDEANKVVFGVGPLTGTGAPCSARVSITSIFPTSYPWELVGTGHMGGHWGAELKFAGWDNVIVEGKSPTPVYVAIMDGNVEIRDAAHLWGNGIYRATTAICQEMGPETSVAAIGQAGENMVRMAVVMNDNSHSAGGIGGVLGSKNLKAIAVKGTGSVKFVADKKAWRDLHTYILRDIMGANNNHCVPNTPQPWAEYWASGSRWKARKGLYWGAANPPIETGECKAGDINRMGFRTMKAIQDLGAAAEKYTVRMGGCHSCPIRCHIHVDVPSVEAKYGVSRYAANTCGGWPGSGWFKEVAGGNEGEIEADVYGKHLADDYGIWNNYSQIQRDFQYAYYNGLIKKNIPEKEYKEIPWALYEQGDPAFLGEIYKRIAFKIGELGKMFGEGTGLMAEKWQFPAEFFKDHNISYWKMGHPKHHSTETQGQSAALINMSYNRDSQCHSHSNFIASGLPFAINKRIAEKLWGPGAIDPSNNYSPMNMSKARFAVWSLIRKELHDSLTLCNWMWPLVASPAKAREYEGDNTLEAQLYTAVTGDQKDVKELDLIGERIFNLHRALTIRDMKAVDMRNKHDLVPDWVFEWPEDKKPFTPGHTKLDRADWEVAKDMFYEVLGWDKATGAPTRATLERLGLKDVADRLDAMGLGV